MAEEKRLSEKSIRILSLIAKRLTYTQIILSNADISREDIVHAANEAIRLNANDWDYHQRLAKTKAEYPNAYEPWTEADDQVLEEMFNQRRRIDEMAKHFKRKPSAIRSRLGKFDRTKADEES